MILSLEGIFKDYRQGESRVEVLKNLNLGVRAGETVAILGPSGSGKSTLLSLLAGLDRPSQGAIRIKNQDLTGLKEEDLTRFRGAHIGIVFQQYHLLPHLTALENVSLPLEIAGRPEKEALEAAEKALHQVRLNHRLGHFPYQLSGGECQRVAMARALVVRPEILLADEPSGNLDSHTGDEVMNLLFELVKSEGMTTVLVTHSELLARRCQRQVWLKDGALVEEPLHA